MKGLESVAIGISSLANAAVASQTTAAAWMLTLMGTYMPLMADYSDLLTQDAYKYYVDSLSVSSDHPEMAAQAAADYQIYSIHGDEMDQDTQFVDNEVQAAKEFVRSLGRAMSQVYALQGPINQIMKSLTSVIKSF